MTSLADRLLEHANANSIGPDRQRDALWCVKSHALHREAADKIAKLREALSGVGDDYMTSEHHHPGHVLIPVAKFEQLRSALGDAQ